jgi:hypothetical protein
MMTVRMSVASSEISNVLRVMGSFITRPAS